jgi:hypothetical protein
VHIVANLFAVTDMVSYLTVQAGTNGTGRRFDRGDQMSEPAFLDFLEALACIGSSVHDVSRHHKVGARVGARGLEPPTSAV